MEEALQEQQEALNENALNNLSLLEGEVSDEPELFDPEEAFKTDDAQQAEADAEEAAAKAGAAMAVGFADTLLRMRYPFVVIPAEQKGQVQEKVAAVISKHGGGLPEWLQPYSEEIELGMTLAATGFGIYLQVQAHNQANQPQPDEPKGGNDASSTSEPEYTMGE
ncbi:hypothetical protein ACFOEK_12190 [Litoribrevibacter euphylliae]|uniref:Uncharacterized protein n=1 Tax=Litoribrevibacter euphylliae TaxID=1834034 RepID=A0ABV7HI28_9GAMM